MKKSALFLIGIITVLFFANTNGIAQSETPYEKYQLVKIMLNDTHEIEYLLSLGLDPLNHEKSAFIDVIIPAYELSVILNHGYETTVIIEDMTQDFLRRNAEDKKNSHANSVNNKNLECAGSEGGGSDPIEYETPTHFNLGSMGGFFTLEEVYEQFDEMHEEFPNLISALEPVSDFETYEGRNLYVARLSDNPDVDEDESEMLLDAIHHAREPESISQLIFYVWYLLENYATDSEVQTILDNTEIYIVPIVNPDGYNYNVVTNPDGGGYWRKNRRDHGNGDYGVDPNRNYGVEWGTNGISFSTSSDVYCGTEAFSEPENQAMKWLCENHEFKLALNNHTYSELLLFPLGYAYDVYCDDHDYFELISGEMVKQNGYTNEISWSLYPASGDSDDWMYEETAEKGKIFAMTPEIGYSFWPVSSDIIPIAKEMIYLNLTAAHIVTDYSLVVETSPPSINTLSAVANFELQAIGLDETNSFTVSIEPISDNIVSTGSAQTFINMATETTATGTLTYDLSPSIVAGEFVEFYLVIDQGGFTTKTAVSKLYGSSSPIFTDEGEDFGAWTFSDWDITSETYYSSPSCFTDTENGEYDNFANSELISATVDLTAATSANMTFYAKWNIENDYDYVQVFVNGIPQCGVYTNMGVADQIEDEPLYDGVQSDWVQEFINLSDYLGGEITISFVLISDGGVTEDGFYFDDLNINVIQDVSILETMKENLLIQANPNPASTSVSLRYNLPRTEEQNFLVITNSMGQIILRDELANRSNAVNIDLSSFAEGVYYYSIVNGENSSVVQKLVILK